MDACGGAVPEVVSEGAVRVGGRERGCGIELVLVIVILMIQVMVNN